MEEGSVEETGSIGTRAETNISIRHLDKNGATRGWMDNDCFVLRKNAMAEGILAVNLFEDALVRNCQGDKRGLEQLLEYRHHCYPRTISAHCGDGITSPMGAQASTLDLGHFGKDTQFEK
eukprot:2319201-Ditylum_brightwellii.AAC.1